jgi:hypothetical protein
MILVKSDFIRLKRENGGDYPIPTNELLYISYFWGKGGVYDWLMLLRQKDWFTKEKCIELCFCMIAVAEELNVDFDYEVLKRYLN